jgi:hypothetical protein
MDIEKAWEKLNEEKFKSITIAEKDLAQIKAGSKHPIQKIRKLQELSLGFVLAFAIGFTWLLFYFQHPYIRLAVGIVLAFYTAAFFYNLHIYNMIKKALLPTLSLKESLERVCSLMTRCNQLQQKVALFVYPFSSTAGFMMGFTLGGGAVEEILQKPVAWVSLLVFCVFSIPGGHYLSKKLNSIYYGRYLTNIKEMIDELNKEA